MLAMQNSIAQYGFIIVLFFCCCSIVSLQYVWQYLYCVYSQNNLSFGSIVLVRYLSIFSTIGVYLQIEILYHLVSFNYICTVHSLVCKDFLHTLEFYDCKNGISRTVLPACFFFPKWLDCDKYFIVVLLCKFYPIISSVLVKEKFSKKSQKYLNYFIFSSYRLKLPSEGPKSPH